MPRPTVSLGQWSSKLLNDTRHVSVSQNQNVRARRTLCHLWTPSRRPLLEQFVLAREIFKTELLIDPLKVMKLEINFLLFNSTYLAREINVWPD